MVVEAYKTIVIIPTKLGYSTRSANFARYYPKTNTNNYYTKYYTKLRLY